MLPVSTFCPYRVTLLATFAIHSQAEGVERMASPPCSPRPTCERVVDLAADAAPQLAARAGHGHLYAVVIPQRVLHCAGKPRGGGLAAAGRGDKGQQAGKVRCRLRLDLAARGKSEGYRPGAFGLHSTFQKAGK